MESFFILASLSCKIDAMQELALYGGKPIRKTKLPYGRQSISREDETAVLEVLRSDSITRGPKVAAFESALAEFAGAYDAVCFTSATAGLHAAMAFYSIGKKEVLLPPITFAATANAILYNHGQPVFLDVEEQSFNLDPTKLPNTTKAAALACVDFAGNPCRYDAIMKWSEDHRVPVIADAAHSFGATYDRKPIGQIANMSVLSFHPVKSMTTGEGGAVLVSSKEQADFLREFKSHGMNPEGEVRPGFFEQRSLGYNYHFTEMQAALGISQLKRLPKMIARRQELAKLYQKSLHLFEHVELPKVTEKAQSAWHLYPIRLRLETLSCSREEFLKALRAENIWAQVHYLPVYWHPYYQKIGYKKGLCPMAEKLYEGEISLPIFPDMSDQDLQDVVLAMEKLCNFFRLPSAK